MKLEILGEKQERPKKVFMDDMKVVGVSKKDADEKVRRR